MKIVNLTLATILAEDAVLANQPLARIVGLLNKSRLKSGEGLVLQPCNSIHTFFMRFSIDVLFLDKENRVIKAISGLKPFRLTSIYWQAEMAIELPAGTITATSTQPGHILSLL